MILLLDIGNTRVKWGCREAGEWRGQGALALDRIEGLGAVIAESSPAWVGVCCVAGEATWRRIEAMLAGRPHHRLQPEFEAHGIVNRYDRPESLGADRYAGLIACRRRGHAPCVLASAGTALTVDALAGDGEFLGGMILPGAALMRRALAEGTAAVPVLAGAWQAFPRSTGDAVATGILTALAGTVEAMRTRLADELAREVPVVLTGGDAEGLAGHLPGPVVIENNLVLEGLLWLARDLGVSDA
ncbi:MAG: type III pantothenate kinase [Gallionellaceae bacterium]|nr:type III pantothenate kinase [Gallionellaceae bacterium]